MSVDCGRTSLNGYPCVKPANHDGNHGRADGREWPEGQNWQDLIGEYFQAQCDHGRSWTGVDDTDIRAPVKVWRCDDCGHEQELPR